MSSPSLKARIRKIAERLQVCPTHGSPLLCGPCRFTWAGTDEEFWELWPLSERLSPYLACLTPSGCVCRVCGKDLWCQPSYETQARQIQVPADLFTDAQLALYRAAGVYASQATMIVTAVQGAPDEA
jgi:hypothetical protein